MDMGTAQLLQQLKDKNPEEQEFHQAVEGMLEYIIPVLEKHPEYEGARILESLLEPERTIMFRVRWQDDKGRVQLNRAYRVQMNSALGPYKGGLRFSPDVQLGTFKFLAFEQIFKNALTGLPLGSGKGGADFNPKGRSDGEIMRFCQAFMMELYRHIGPRLDVPAGDMGVGKQEIGYLFGAYKKLQNQFEGAITGKGSAWGGSLLRPEATGYGLVYFAQQMLEHTGDRLEGKRCLVSGAGKVALHCIEKLLELGARVITVSDSSGFALDKEGIDEEKLQFLKKLKLEENGRVKEYAEKYGLDYTEVDKDADENPLWDVAADLVFPCATQNEVSEKDAQNLLENGISLLAEGANMPLTGGAGKKIVESRILYAPGIASNAGGVAVSAMEMMQNHLGAYWQAKEIDQRLHDTMNHIHETCLQAAEEYGFENNYAAGAFIAGFKQVADAMLAQGVI